MAAFHFGSFIASSHFAGIEVQSKNAIKLLSDELNFSLEIYLATSCL
jgi:hypothetical protein